MSFGWRALVVEVEILVIVIDDGTCRTSFHKQLFGDHCTRFRWPRLSLDLVAHTAYANMIPSRDLLQSVFFFPLVIIFLFFVLFLVEWSGGNQLVVVFDFFDLNLKSLVLSHFRNLLLNYSLSD